MATGSETPKPQIPTGATRHAMAQVKERIPTVSGGALHMQTERKIWATADFQNFLLDQIRVDQEKKFSWSTRIWSSEKF